MAKYAKRSYRRARGKTTRPWYLKKYNALQMAQKAVQGVSYLKGLVNSERMYFDTSVVNSVDYSGVGNCLTNIAQGDADGNRTGISLLAKSMYIQATVSYNTAGTAIFNTVRLVLLMDTEINGSSNQPSWTDLITSSYVGNTYGVIAPINKNTSTRYKIMWDKRIQLSISGDRTKTVTKYIPLQTHIKYTGPNATDYQRNQFYLMQISDQSTLTPTVTFIARIGYHDN